MNQIKNKKVLITGGAGFIGSHLTKKLVELGAKVSVTVKYNSIIDSPRLVKIWDKINVIEADLRNTDSVIEMKKMNFDIVFHLAAQSFPKASFDLREVTYDTNILGTDRLLHSILKLKLN